MWYFLDCRILFFTWRSLKPCLGSFVQKQINSFLNHYWQWSMEYSINILEMFSEKYMWEKTYSIFFLCLYGKRNAMGSIIFNFVLICWKFFSLVLFGSFKMCWKKSQKDSMFFLTFHHHSSLSVACHHSLVRPSVLKCDFCSGPSKPY